MRLLTIGLNRQVGADFEVVMVVQIEIIWTFLVVSVS